MECIAAELKHLQIPKNYPLNLARKRPKADDKMSNVSNMNWNIFRCLKHSSKIGVAILNPARKRTRAPNQISYKLKMST